VLHLIEKKKLTRGIRLELQRVLGQAVEWTQSPDPTCCALRRKKHASHGTDLEVHRQRVIKEGSLFSKVMEELFQQNRPLIGHNMMFDLLFLWQTCVGDLPATLGEWLMQLDPQLPPVIDTKVLASYLLRDHNIALRALDAWADPVLGSPGAPKLALASSLQDYLNQSQLHDAVFDAYATGRGFVALATYAQTELTSWGHALLDIPAPWANMVYLHNNVHQELCLRAPAPELARSRARAAWLFQFASAQFAVGLFDLLQPCLPVSDVECCLRLRCVTMTEWFVELRVNSNTIPSNFSPLCNEFVARARALPNGPETIERYEVPFDHIE
jgi:DNA polymerase III epsilon subunit-like protein